MLSGGGARGAAHIGVLKVLDDLRVPIDAIAGTSMGAVVGGLYASGFSAREIETIMTSVNWQDAFRDRPSRTDLTFRRKEEEENFLVNFPLGLRSGHFQLPKGLIQGQKLSQILRRLTLPIAEVTDFDALPTRFRAVATDLETGDPVVMHDGDLASAMRASLSAPGVLCARRARWAPLGRWRSRRESAYRCRARHGSRHPHRRGREHAALDTRQTHQRAGDFESDACDSDQTQ